MYSQNAEEKAILDFFGDQTGTFIDLGANDGVTLSNTRALAEKGWKGVFVEASPKAFRKLKDNYFDKEGFYFYNFAIGNVNDRLTFHESSSLISKDDVSLVGTFHDSEMNRFKGTVQYTPVEVQCYRWKTFLNRCSIKAFDFVSIDIEGSDLVVLKQMDLTECKLLCIENNGNENLKSLILEYTGQFGMKNIIYTSGENIIISR